MITWLLLLSLFRISTQDGEENGVLRCGPQNVTLTSSGQTLLLTWDDDPSCSAVRDELVYALEVFVADKSEHKDEVAATPAQTGSTHSWKWTSRLPLECASHLVQLRFQYNNQSSPWTQKTLPGEQVQKGISVFPKNKMFEVNSTVTFCCILPEEKNFSRMYLLRYESSSVNTTKISERVYTLTVLLDHGSKGLNEVMCEGKGKGENLSGACFHAGYPPGESDLQCETRDLKHVSCVWNAGKRTGEPPPLARKYQLQGSPCNDGQSGKCSKPLMEAGERNWTLTVENSLGKLELRDWADLTRRVRMFAPGKVTALTENARNITLNWSWAVQNYSRLNLTCQVNVRDGEADATTESFGVNLTAAVIKDLRPYWDYDVRVRCGTAQHFWKWGDWSQSVKIRTKGDVPDALDVWMKVKDTRTVITWKKLLAKQSHGDILGYEVAWAKTKEKNQPNEANVSGSNYSLALQLDPSEDYTITVTAKNINGSSLPSTIIVPRHNPDELKVKPSWINGSNGGFTLSWSDSPNATCGYIVDWCPAFGDCTVEWLKVRPNQTNARIFSENFKAGLRYLLSIYACTDGAPVLLQRREGYIRETKIEGELVKLNVQQQGSDVVASWERIHLEKQSASIQGYILYYNDSGSVFNVSTADPGATSLTAKNLNISTYNFKLTAQTALGLCGNSSTDITLTPSADNLIVWILISLGAVFIVLATTTVLCYRHWACIKHKVYPPIPKPVLSDKWLTSPDERIICHHHLNQPQCSEATAVAELQDKCRPLEPAGGQDYMTFTHTQTPRGYYNKPLKNSLPRFILPTTGPPSLLGLPSSPVNGVFPNPSYDIPVQGKDQHYGSGPEIQEGIPILRSVSGYHPQSPEESPVEEEPDSPISCVSTYILLPQKTST